MSKKNKGIIFSIAIIIVAVSNSLTFFTNAASIVRLNFIAESVLTILLGPIYSVLLVCLENILKLKISLLDGFLNYSFFLKLANIVILYLVLLCFKKLKGTVKIDTLAIFIAGIFQSIFSKYLASRINSIFDAEGYSNAFGYYLSKSVLINSLSQYMLSAAISVVVIIILRKVLKIEECNNREIKK